MLTEKGRDAQIAALEVATEAPSYTISIGLGVVTLVVLHGDTIDEVWLRTPDGTEVKAPVEYHEWLKEAWRDGLLPQVDEWLREQEENAR